MSESQVVGDGNNSLKSWYKRVLDGVVRDMLTAGAVVGTAVEATPVWAVPNEILISRVWAAGQQNSFIWTIAGERMITDHIVGAVAATPRDVARHFSLKWQVDAERLYQIARRKDVPEIAGKQIETYAGRVIQCAERLYDLASREDIWQHQLSD
jgi:hypothetical protein